MLLYISVNAQSPINLVPNPSFEKFTSCPFSQAQIKLAISWDTLKAGGGGTPDYFNSCDLTTVAGVPYNPLSFQNARTGNAYSLVVAYYTLHTDIREYIQVRLIEKLKPNKAYCITSYVNLHNFSNCAIDELGMYLDNGTINTSFYGVASSYTPQVKSPVGIFIVDTLKWTKIQGIYSANGNDEYLTIGNFKTDTQTNTITFQSSSAYSATYYIDDVSVIDMSTTAYAGTDTLLNCLGDSVFIGRPLEVGLECTWYHGAMPVATGAGIWVKPTTNTQYVVQQDVCGIISYDTVRVMLKDTNCHPLPVIVTSKEIPNTFSPNGDGVNEVWEYSIGALAHLQSFSVYNRWGNLVHQVAEPVKATIVQWDGYTTSGEACSEGVYYYVISYLDNKGELQNKKGFVSLFR